MPAAPKMGDEAVRAKTGKTWAQWFRLLDRAGAKDMGHAAIARLLAQEHGVAPWWSQNITVEYERARGKREVGQRTSGAYEATAQRTTQAAPEEVRAAWEARVRGKWMPAALRAHLAKGWRSRRWAATKQGTILRMDVPTAQGKEKVEVAFTPKGQGTVVHVTHTALAAKADRERLKPLWGQALDALQARWRGA
jgi:hypothetical protein